MSVINKVLLFVLSTMIIGCASKMPPHPAIIKRAKDAPIISPFEDAVAHLGRQISQKGFERLKISIGKITYGNSDISSEFSGFVSSELSMALIKSNKFEEISRKELTQILEEQELSLSGLIDPSEVYEIGKIKGIDAILIGTYWEQARDVRINLSLLKVVTAEKIAATSFNLPKNMLPIGLRLRPENYDISVATLIAWDEIESDSGDFRIRVWPDKGKSTIYKEEENIIIFFKSNRNCYLTLYHTNVEGKIQLLFPNLYHRDNYIQADRVYSIPDQTMAFELKVKPPFGAEIIKAIASLQPFPSEESLSTKETFRTLGMATQNNIRGIIARGIAVIPVKARSEDTCIFTTMEK